MGTVEIKKIVHGGYGLAFHEGRTVFIPFTAPGETVEFEAAKEKKGVVFGRATRIVAPSPARQEPPCPVFGTCGGCHFQHVSYEAEIEAKRLAALEDLARIGKIKMEMTRVIPSPERYGYRSGAIFKTDAEGKPGFMMAESNRVVPFPPEGCRLLPEEMRAAISALPPTALAPSREVQARIDRFGNVSFWGLADRIGPPESLMEAGGFQFPVSPEAFFQGNRFLSGALMELVSSLPRGARRRLLDLYCGVGFFTLPLSRIVTEALGLEVVEDAVRGAAASARLNGVSNVKFRRADVEAEIGRMRDFDLVVVDPPRGGLPKGALEGLVRLRAAEIIFVSCDSPAFARDAAALVEAGYIPSEVDLVDLFPATYHAEIVALFRKG